MNDEEFVAALNKMDLVHLRNFEWVHREEVKNLAGNQEIKDDIAVLYADLHGNGTMDKELLNLGWDLDVYYRVKEQSPEFANAFANKWGQKADQAMLDGDKLETVRALDICLFFDPTNIMRSCYLAQHFARAKAVELFVREARFAFFYLQKKCRTRDGKLTGRAAQSWKQFKKMGVQLAPDHLLFKDETDKSLLAPAPPRSPLEQYAEKAGIVALHDTAELETTLGLYRESVADRESKDVNPVKKQLNLLRDISDIRREVGQPWQSGPDSLRVRICDHSLFDKRCGDEGDIENKKQLEVLNGITKNKRLPFIPESVFDEIRLIGEEQPNFHEVTEIILDTLYAQCLSGMPACLPPLLMHGAARVGKTRYVRRIAKVLGLPYCDVTLSGNSDAFKVTGLSRYWASAGPGIIAATLAQSEIANPVFLLDEIDKTHKSDKGDPLSRILLLLEKETATTLKDDFIDVPMDASYASYLATCNRIDELPAPLLSRFICVNIKPLDYNGRCTFVSNVYQELRTQEKYGAFFTDKLVPATLNALAECEEMSGREIKRVILQGMQRACRGITIGSKPDKSVALKVNDLRLPAGKKAGRIPTLASSVLNDARAVEGVF